MVATTKPIVATGENEQTPLLVSSVESASKNMEILRVILLGALMILCSAAVINFNKSLISGSFPYPIHLVLCHMGSGTMFSSIALFSVPSFFPSLKDPEKRAQINVKFVFARVLPIACCFAASLVLSNVAYLYASVTFLQMMKEANVVIVYALSLVCGLEALRTRNVLVLLFILACTTMTVTGEINFSLKGTIIQGTCQLFESSRLVLQSILLSGALKLDTWTYNLFVMPVCFFTLALLLGAHRMNPSVFGEDMQTPTLADFHENAHLLLPNFALAFSLNVTIALFIKHSSALSMVMASLLKDLFVVVISVVVMTEGISKQQTIFFFFQLCGIFTWSMMKTYPERFQNGIVGGYVSLFTGATQK